MAWIVSVAETVITPEYRVELVVVCGKRSAIVHCALSQLQLREIGRQGRVLRSKLLLRIAGAFSVSEKHRHQKISAQNFNEYVIF